MRREVPPGPLLLVVDLAGTTLAIADQVPGALRAAFASIGETLSDVEIGRVRGRSKAAAIEEILMRRGVGSADAGARARALVVDFNARLRTSLEGGIAEVPGAQAALAQLRGNGHRVVLATGFDRGTAAFLLDQMGWVGVADAVVTGDDVELGRPAPDTVLRAMALTGVREPGRVVVVGDTVADMECAIRAGAGATVGVLTGAGDRAALQEVDESVVVLPSIAELPDWLAGQPRCER